MAHKNEKIHIPATGENTQVEEDTLLIEELESRVAPNGAPMPPPWVD
jgi:hypothetical protein